MAGTLAHAEPHVEVIENPYPVDALTKDGLIWQMSTRGRVGFWAFTRNWVTWRGFCDVTVRIKYTMPVHTRPEQMSPALRAEWNRMVTAMREHEEQHGQHAINAGREVERAGCKNGYAIVRKWARADKAYDARTQHGRSEGVFLR